MKGAWGSPSPTWPADSRFLFDAGVRGLVFILLFMTFCRYNTFDTIRATERLAQESCSQNAFYLDDQMSGWEFYGNTIINATTGVLLGGGRRNGESPAPHCPACGREDTGGAPSLHHGRRATAC